MSILSLSPKWFGVYRYDAGQVGLLEYHVDTAFEMVLVMGWFGRFRGTIQDAAPGCPEPANVHGRWTGNRIQFRKVYTKLWVSDQSGKLLIVPDQPSYELYYEGELLEDRTRIQGVWSVRGETRWIQGAQWDFPECTGTWTAQAG